MYCTGGKTTGTRNGGGATTVVDPGPQRRRKNGGGTTLVEIGRWRMLRLSMGRNGATTADAGLIWVCLQEDGGRQDGKTVLYGKCHAGF